MISTAMSGSSAATTSRMRWLSDDGTPAAGSSSSSTRGFCAERDGDLHQPLAAIGQFAHQLERIVGQPQRVEMIERLVDHLALAQPAERHRLLQWPSRSPMVMQRFSSTVRPRNSWLIWKVRASPRRARSAWRQRGDVLAIEQHPAGMRLEHAGDQIDQRGLAGAVRADQRVARAALERKIDVARDRQRAESPVQVPRLAARRVTTCSPLRPE